MMPSLQTLSLWPDENTTNLQEWPLPTLNTNEWALPPDMLALDKRTLACYATLGDLLTHALCDQLEIPVRSALAMLQPFCQAGQVDWVGYWRAASLSIFPISQDAKGEIEFISNLLPTTLEAITRHEFDERGWLILQHRYGLNGVKKKTLAELGDAFELSRERVRQIEDKVMQRLREVLFHQHYAGASFRVHPAIIAWLTPLCASPSLLLTEPMLASVLQMPKAIESKNLVSLLFALAGYVPLKLPIPTIESIWIQEQCGYFDYYQNGISRLHRLLTHDTAHAWDELDLVALLNRHQSGRASYSLEQVRMMIAACSSLEQREDRWVWGTFASLQGQGTLAERILLEHGSPMHMSEMIRGLNHRLSCEKRAHPNSRTILNQIAQDDRFVAIGRSGYWGLKIWANITIEHIVPLMQQYLLEKNAPATVEEIYTSISKQRPMQKTSIVMYLQMNETMFRRYGRTLWGLAAWPMQEKPQIWNTAQVADFVAGFFRTQRAKQLDYAVIKAALMEIAHVSDRVAMGLLNRCPAIRRFRLKSYGPVTAEYQPQYQQILEQTTGQHWRKTMTIQQRVHAKVQEIFTNAPTVEMPLADLIAQLQDAIVCSDRTLYAYIRQIERIELVKVAHTHHKVCRWRDAS